jgi:hypothetical protein
LTYDPRDGDDRSTQRPRTARLFHALADNAILPPADGGFMSAFVRARKAIG